MDARSPSLLLLAIGSLAAAAMTASPARAAPARPGGSQPVRVGGTAAPLTDLRPSVPDPTDGAHASAFVITGGSATLALLRVHGLDRRAAGRTLGTHLHVGPCLAGQGGAASRHVQHDHRPSPRTEVWLDLAVDAQGSAVATALVPFALSPNTVGSVVIHERRTAADGDAGARLACLPLAL